MKIKYNYLCTLILSFASIHFVNAQMITFQQHYLTSYDRSGKDVMQTADGGYLIAGTTENSDPADLDLQMIKTDAYGNIQSTKTFGGSRVDYPNNMIATGDGNFFIVGYSQSFGPGDLDIWLLKVDQDGDTLWTKRYGGGGNEEGKEIISTADGNYAIIGASNSYTGTFSNNDMQLIKINSSGDVIFSKNYGTAQYESARSVKLCSDGGFIISGKTSADPLSIASIYLVRTNSNGDTMWTKTLSGGSNSWEGKSIVVNSDDTYTLAIDDSSASNDSDVRILKLSSDANTTIFSKMYGGTLKDICKTIRPTTDGGYIVSAISRSFGWTNPDMWILKLDANGDQQWAQHFGGGGHEHAYSTRQTADGGYIAVGHARSFNPSTWELYLVKMDAGGMVGIKELAAQSKLALYPNPSTGLFKVDLSDLSEFETLSITNTLGQNIYSDDLTKHSNDKELSVDLSAQMPGIYFISLQSSTQKITRKLILD